MKQFSLLIYILLLGGSFSSYSQSDCKSVYTGLQEVYASYDDDNTYLKFTTQLTDESGVTPPVESEVWRSKNLIHYKTNSLDVYQDTSYQVIISHENRTITLMKTPKGVMNKGNVLETDFITYDSLIQTGIKTYCQQITSRKQKLVLYDQAYQGTENHREKQLTYVFDKVSKKLEQITEEYKLKGELVQKNKYVFLVFSTKIIQKNKKALSVIYTQNQLKPVYKDYKIIDIR